AARHGRSVGPAAHRPAARRSLPGPQPAGEGVPRGVPGPRPARALVHGRRDEPDRPLGGPGRRQDLAERSDDRARALLPEAAHLEREPRHLSLGRAGRVRPRELRPRHRLPAAMSSRWRELIALLAALCIGLLASACSSTALETPHLHFDLTVVFDGARELPAAELEEVVRGEL